MGAARALRKLNAMSGRIDFFSYTLSEFVFVYTLRDTQAAYCTVTIACLIFIFFPLHYCIIIVPVMTVVRCK